MEQKRGATLARWCAAAMLAACAFSARAGVADEAMEGAVADGVTTAIGLAVGAAELNPLGPVLGIGVKYAVMEYAKALPDTERPAVYAAAASLWQGASANNMCVAAAILSGGTFAPACIALGIAWGMKTWGESEHERQFWEGCKALRDYAQRPDMPCIYNAPGQPPARPQEIMVQLIE
ncbi:hypothetical protein H8N03_20070 [Ramlibacter sp. USB13]|uniref:Uncharacterized protein n=1 Tax=Ramlibacter cellulosilyticus TaxID=2764187 RepID=A0A923MW65_9BURK|nr:hypothetical protein [Ramlibacter cellulosilyticus]MBC5785254.1 hypothetical protein [Ramlibacter cellulosilyticus]